jgi:hypothetical protein
MKKSLILYKSKSGFSKDYATLLNQEIFSDLFDINDFQGNVLEYENIYFFGGLYAAGINKLKLFKELTKEYKKHLSVIAVGATPGTDKDIEEITKNNFTKEELNKYKFYYLRGGFNYKKCKPVDKILMLLLKAKLKLKKNKVPDEIGMLNAYSKPLNFVKKERLSVLLADYDKI